MTGRIVLGVLAAFAGVISYAFGAPRWLAVAVALGIFALVERLGWVSGPFEPSIREILQDGDNRGEGADGSRPTFGSLIHVETDTDILGLPPTVEGVLVRRMTDEKLSLLARQAPGLRHLVSDGSNRVTDAGLTHLRRFRRLEHLDLEWSAVTDAGLHVVAALSSLRWVDLCFCEGTTAAGMDRLRRQRPDLQVSGGTTA